MTSAQGLSLYSFSSRCVSIFFILLSFLSTALCQLPSPTPATAASTAAAASSSASIPATAAPGSLSVTKPDPAAGTSYYKIAPAVNVTFAWNFTSVLSFGTSLTVQAYCTSNANTYTITTLPATATQMVWNPYNYSINNVAQGSKPLVQESYRLQIFDERGLSAGSTPGLLSPNDDAVFALYIPQSYTPLADGWTCSGCTSGVAGLQGSPLLVGLVAAILAMLLSGWSICSRPDIGLTARDHGARG